MSDNRLMIDIEGLTLSDIDCTLLSRPCVGGIILFSRNVESAEQVTALTQAIREVRSDIWIAVDQEGGRVQRLREGFTRIPPMRHLGHYYDQNPEAALALSKELGWLMAAEVRAVGIDFSFAPVLDVDFERSGVIGDRAFHAQLDPLVTLSGAFIDGMHEADMPACGKHFPGHGHVIADSHLALPEDDRSEADICEQDMDVFKRLANKLDSVMPAHVIYHALAKEPAGFSAHILEHWLRSYCGFKGIVFSDDLKMEGAAFAGDFPSRCDAALNAGCDMVLICNDRPATEILIEHLSQEDLRTNIDPLDLSCWATAKPGSLGDLHQTDRYNNIQQQLKTLASFIGGR